ncbi:HNH endonuclease [Deinococcus alpinitundrae]|uniref:HNH endonuclease n=1 Tax=Deinococcus alpinitundrae TaxID=468913 RepID=UPI001379E39F|nr:HNH endonuclease [Deinococcus alpinitundrae]
MDLAHRRAAARLGRLLLFGEVVHHLDGDSTNNASENLLVLSSQRFHAHIEHVLRQERRS